MGQLTCLKLYWKDLQKVEVFLHAFCKLYLHSAFLFLGNLDFFDTLPYNRERFTAQSGSLNIVIFTYSSAQAF